MFTNFRCFSGLSNPFRITTMSGPSGSKSSPYFSTRQTREEGTDSPMSLKEKLDKIAGTGKPSRKRITGQVAKIKGSESVASPIKKKDVNIAKADVELKVQKWEPKHWKEVLDKIRTMRAAKPAPVDKMGCHMCSDEKATPEEKRFHILVALMLSSQTKDEVTFEAMKRLRDHGLTPSCIAQTPPAELESILIPVSFYKNKSKFLIKTCQLLIDQYQGDIPNTVNDLVKLPGVGPKMAHICMSAAWGIVSGIGVDTHVHRISNRLKWLPKETKDPEKTRQELEKWLPHELWDEINVLLVGFGQTTCNPTAPKCHSCLLAKLCPSCKV